MRTARLYLLLTLLTCSSVALWWYYRSPQLAATPYTRSSIPLLTNEPIIPLPLAVELDSKRVSLGEQLFTDPILSHDNTISCSSCHSLTKGGTDQQAHSTGVGGQLGSLNAPTVFNSALNFKQFWDGRAETLEEQVDGPTHAVDEMASNWPEIIGKLTQSPAYVQSFGEAYPDGIRPENVRDALATFERSLNTPNSRFDRYLLGDSNALTSEEREGYRLFKEYGCASCHQGINIGGNLFQKFGVMSPPLPASAIVTKTDLGRFNVTGKEADKFVFKVPSLRNVSLTAPYLHDGSVKRLEDAVKVMSVVQLGRPLTPSETDLIVKFLKTLSGEYKGKAL